MPGDQIMKGKPTALLASKNRRHDINKDRYFHIFNGGNQKGGARAVTARSRNICPHHSAAAGPAAAGGERAFGRGKPTALLASKNRRHDINKDCYFHIFNGGNQKGGAWAVTA